MPPSTAGVAITTFPGSSDSGDEQRKEHERAIVEAVLIDEENRMYGSYRGEKSGISSRIREIAIVALFLAVHLLLFSERAMDKYSEIAIRGGVGMRPIGEVCESMDGAIKTINNRHAIVFDAGSTGSRVHVYEFQYCGDTLKVLVDEVFEQVKPGLSSFSNNPKKAAKSLQPLLKTSLRRVPLQQHKCTPLIVKATAGLRLLSDVSVQRILENVKSLVASHQFIVGDGLVKKEEAVNVMDGAEEGVFAWVTVNFLQNHIPIGGRSSKPFLPDETSVVMDLGGGSTQIVFAVPRENGFDMGKYPEYYYHLKLHGNEIDLYQHSYLGFGLMEARKQIKMMHVQRMVAGGLDKRALRFPCNPTGFTEDLKIDGTIYTIIGDSSGWDACLGVVNPLFRKDAPCTVEPCSFNGIHQPAFRSKSLVAFSYFFDRLIPLGLTSPVTPFEIDREGRKLCNAAVGSRFAAIIHENPQWCLDLAYIYSLIRIGYGIDVDQPIVVTKQINGYEAGWSLGAALKLLENSKSCN